MYIRDFDKSHIEIKRNILHNSRISTDKTLVLLCHYVRMTTGASFAVQTASEKLPALGTNLYSQMKAIYSHI